MHGSGSVGLYLDVCDVTVRMLKTLKKDDERFTYFFFICVEEYVK